MNKPLIVRSISVFEDVNFLPSANNDPRIVMTQPVINFIVPFVPTQLGFSIVSFVSHFLANERYDLEIVIINKSTSEEIQLIPWVLQPENQDSTFRESITPTAFFISNVKNMVVETEGTYVVEVRAQGEKLGDYFFEVFLKERLMTDESH